MSFCEAHKLVACATWWTYVFSSCWMVKKPKQKAQRKTAAQHTTDPDVPEEGWPMPDPSWCDIPPIVTTPPTRYEAFKPPSAFADAMVADSSFWASPDVGKSVVRAIVSAITQQCVPWHFDYARWREHATDFFRRLCSHRRGREDTVTAAINEVRVCITSVNEKIDSLAEEVKERLDFQKTQIAGLHKALVRLQNHQAAPGDFRGAVAELQALSVHGNRAAAGGTSAASGAASSTDAAHSTRGRSPHARARCIYPEQSTHDPELGISDKVFRAQLNAIAARSSSPSIDTVRACLARSKSLSPDITQAGLQRERLLLDATLQQLNTYEQQMGGSMPSDVVVPPANQEPMKSIGEQIGLLNEAINGGAYQTYYDQSPRE